MKWKYEIKEDSRHRHRVGLGRLGWYCGRGPARYAVRPKRRQENLASSRQLM